MSEKILVVSVFAFLLFGATEAQSQSVPSYIPSDGLVAWYPFEGNAQDQSGNGNNLQIHGPVLTADRASNPESAFLFTGTPTAGQWLEPVNSKPFAADKFTCSVWIKPINFNPINSVSVNFYYQGIIGFFPSSWVQGPAYTLSLFQLDNSRLFSGNWTPKNKLPIDWSTGDNVINNSSIGLILTESIIKKNEWSHLVLTVNGNSLTLYVNGKILSSTKSSVSYVNQKKFVIGGNADGPAGKIMGGFQGVIDDVGFWSRALSPTEILELHNGLPSYNTVTDVDGNEYKTVVIGEQEWMAENLRATRFSNGDPIPYVVDRCEWSVLEGKPAYCFPENDPGFNIPYGKLYNWYAVADARNVCPSGWHPPTDAELHKLIIQFDSLANENAITPEESVIAARFLKSAREGAWQSVDSTATNSSGFSFLPAGHREFYGAKTFTLGRYGYLWTTTAMSDWQATMRILDCYGSVVSRAYSDKRSGLSVRCIKGEADPSFNSSPYNLELITSALEGDLSPGTPVGKFKVKDNEGGPFLLTLAKGEGDTDNYLFSDAGYGTELKFLKLSPEQSEIENRDYHIRMRVVDGGGLAVEKALTVNIQKNFSLKQYIPQASLITGLILSVFSIGVLVINSKRRNAKKKSEHPVFEKIELELVQTIFNKPDHTVLVDEINRILGTTNRSIEVQKKHRSEMVRSINSKYQTITGDKDNLLWTERLESDKRQMMYVTDMERLTKLRGLLKVMGSF